MGSSKTTQETKIPEYLEEAGRLAVERAQQIQQMGYMPYMGPEVAAINPFEQALAQNVGGMASAFGMSAPSSLDMGMPTVTQGGMTGYSSFPIYQSALERLREQRPEQYEFFANQTGFDPITGAATGYVPPEAGGDAGGDAGNDGAPYVHPNRSDNDGPSHAEIMDMHYGQEQGPPQPAYISGGFDPFGPKSTSTYSNRITGKETGPLGTAIGRMIF